MQLFYPAQAVSLWIFTTSESISDFAIFLPKPFIDNLFSPFLLFPYSFQFQGGDVIDAEIPHKCIEQIWAWRSNQRSASFETNRSNKSANLTAEKILPGAFTLEDINKYINAAKKEKLEQLKKKLPSKR